MRPIGIILLFIIYSCQTIDFYGYVEPSLSPLDTISSSYALCLKNGDRFAREISSYMCDFARTGDKMVHTSSFFIDDGKVFALFMVNYTDSEENPSKLNIRFHISHLDSLDKVSYYDICSVGDVVFNKEIIGIYDSVLYSDNEVIHILWNALFKDSGFCILHQSFSIKNKSFSEIRQCHFSYCGFHSLFEQKAMSQMLNACGKKGEDLIGHLILMPKGCNVIENGGIYHYTGLGCAGNFNCVVKTKDFINWEYVTSPPFKNEALYEPCTYIIGDSLYYYCRQNENHACGFLAKYSISQQCWSNPVYVREAQSRSDFFYYENHLYLLYSPFDRNHISVLKIDENDLSTSFDVQTATVPSSYYPVVQVYEGELYMLFTKERRHIYLSKFSI